MQRSTVAMIVVVALAVSAAGAYVYPSGLSSQTPQLSREPDVFFQASAYSALQAGDYDGEMTLKELRAHGDFGLGTFAALDGELIALNGTFYHTKSDGNAYLANDSMKSPWADVTWFDQDHQLVLSGASNNPLNYSELQHYLEGQLPTRNIFYAVKIMGEYSYLKVRNPQKQAMPYPPLSDALKNQSILELHNVTGTLVGFFSPQYSSGICAPGWHFHFLTADNTRGGHVLEVVLQRATIQIDDTMTLSVKLPHTATFYVLNLTTTAD